MSLEPLQPIRFEKSAGELLLRFEGAQRVRSASRAMSRLPRLFSLPNDPSPPRFDRPGAVALALPLAVFFILRAFTAGEGGVAAAEGAFLSRLILGLLLIATVLAPGGRAAAGRGLSSAALFIVLIPWMLSHGAQRASLLVALAACATLLQLLFAARRRSAKARPASLGDLSLWVLGALALQLLMRDELLLTPAPFTRSCTSSSSDSTRSSSNLKSTFFCPR